LNRKFALSLETVGPLVHHLRAVGQSVSFAILAGGVEYRLGVLHVDEDARSMMLELGVASAASEPVLSEAEESVAVEVSADRPLRPDPLVEIAA